MKTLKEFYKSLNEEQKKFFAWLFTILTEPQEDEEEEEVEVINE